MNLTPQAKKRWEEIPQDVRIKLLNNVYCSTCKKMVGIGNVSGKMERGDLILQGVCTACGNPVARLIEGS